MEGGPLRAGPVGRVNRVGHKESGNTPGLAIHGRARRALFYRVLMNKSIHPVLNLPTFRGAWKSSCAVERGPSLVTPSNGGISSAGLAGAVGGGKKMSISSEDSLSDFEELGGTRSFKRFFTLIACICRLTKVH